MHSDLIYHFFSDDDFLRISNKIKEMEKLSSGEIKVSIKEKKPLLHKRKSIKELAEKEFVHLNMHATRDKTGILLYLLLSERQFYILADEGINAKVPNNTWEEIRDDIQHKFRNGDFTKGLLSGIERVGKILSEHFPLKPDDTNELSNKVEL
ncbi:TPM domain-containing protein [Melioribacteraceae bacterium 4301-Me]|uniref:TPM domain-containing protein n=1 Tax=Pyranulibacter aquaticus TaxID=3163344 RepID=UPI003594D627